MLTGLGSSMNKLAPSEKRRRAGNRRQGQAGRPKGIAWAEGLREMLDPPHSGQQTWFVAVLPLCTRVTGRPTGIA